MNKEINQHFIETQSILNDIDCNIALEYATWTKDKAKIKFQKIYLLFLLQTTLYIGVILVLI